MLTERINDDDDDDEYANEKFLRTIIKKRPTPTSTDKCRIVAFPNKPQTASILSAIVMSGIDTTDDKPCYSTTACDIRQFSPPCCSGLLPRLPWRRDDANGHASIRGNWLVTVQQTVYRWFTSSLCSASGNFVGELPPAKQTRNAWQSAACSLPGIAVSPPSEY